MFTATASKDKDGKISTAYLSEDGERIVTIDGDDSVSGWVEEKQSDVTSERKIFLSYGDARQGTKIKDLSDEQLDRIIETSEAETLEFLGGNKQAATVGKAPRS